MRAHGIAFRAADESGGDGTAATVLVAIDVAFILKAMRVLGGRGSTPGGMPADGAESRLAASAEPRLSPSEPRLNPVRSDGLREGDELR